MNTEDFIVTGASPQQLTVSLIDAGVLELREAGAFPPEGAVFSYIGRNDNGAHAFVSITAEQEAIDAIKDRLQKQINVPGAPLRMRAGGIVPDVITRYKIAAFKVAAEKLGALTLIDEAVMALVNQAGDKSLYVWWEQTDAISREDAQWAEIEPAVQWPKGVTADDVFALAAQI